MRKAGLSLFFFIVAGFFGFSPRQVFAMCAGPYSLAEYRKQADIVVVGTATIVVDNDAFLSVSEYFKGHGPDTIRVTGNATESGISSVDFHLEAQKKYLLFLKFTDTDELRTNACSGNRELGKEGLSSSDRTSLGKSKITPVMVEKLYKPSGYVISRPAIIMMVISGGIIFLLLLLSVMREKRKKKVSVRPKAKQKKK